MKPTMPSMQTITNLARLLGAPICLWLIERGGNAELLSVIVLIALLEATDVATICTKFPATRAFDAACVAIFHAAVFLAFMATGWMPLWAVVAIYAGEISLPYLRSFATQFAITPPPSNLERTKSAIQGFSQIVVLGIVLWSGPQVSLGDVDAMLLIFSANVAMSLAVFLQNFAPLMRAKLR